MIANHHKLNRDQEDRSGSSKLVDIAGIVKGASEGEGLGNKFLSHIRQVDAIIRVVRCFEDPDVVHVAGAVDPLADIDTIENRVDLADMQTLENALPKAERTARTGDKAAKLLVATIEKHLALYQRRKAIADPFADRS
ncbi:MAG: GTPase [Pirellulaceae bacterium]